MDEAELRSDLATGETPSIEFKRCGNSVGRDTFETICSFANSFGGSIYLGVEDDGNAIGIPEENIVPVKRNVTNVVHNPNVFDRRPPLSSKTSFSRARRLFGYGFLPVRRSTDTKGGYSSASRTPTLS